MEDQKRARQLNSARLAAGVRACNVRDAYHVRRTRCARGYSRHNDDALTGFGEVFPVRDLARAPDHVVLIARVLGDHAVNAPYQ